MRCYRTPVQRSSRNRRRQKISEVEGSTCAYMPMHCVCTNRPDELLRVCVELQDAAAETETETR